MRQSDNFDNGAILGALLLTFGVGGLLFALIGPAMGQPASPPSISQSAQEGVSVTQLMAVIAERDRQYSQRFEAQEKSTTIALAAAERAVQAALTAAKEAVQKAEMASEKRFDSVNEFRNTLKDQQLTLMTRGEAEARLKDLDRRISELATEMVRRASESRGAGELWGIIAGVAGILIAIAAVVLSYSSRQHRRA